jgi:hypothetical protein
MKTYSVFISQSFSNYVEVKADTVEQAEILASEMLESGEIDPLNWDGDVFMDIPEEITA